MKRTICAALLAAAAASPALAAGALITNPDWDQKPSGEDLSKFWPPGASGTGRAVISCQVTVQGKLDDCVVISESPPGAGFGAAALRMSVLFRMKPQTRNGIPVAGGSVRIPLNFALDGLTPPAWMRPPTPEEIAAVRPPGTRAVPGVALLSCRLTKEGAPKECEVKEESPKGRGFGAAALKLAPSLRLKPAMYYGSVSPGDVIFPVAFPAETVQTGVAEFGDDLSSLDNAPWLEAPTQAEMAAAWPSQAPRDLETGSARLHCRVSTESRLTGCTVISEDPEGVGFGAAALQLAARFRLRGSMDQKALARMRVNLPFGFTNPRRAATGIGVVTKPNWVSYISSEQMVALYPPAAYDAHVRTGRGVVECLVAAGGGLSACKPVSEDPSGLGFGEAAVAAAAAFAVNPWSDDGRPVEGARIRMPIRFVAADLPTDPQPATAASTAPAR